jgi:hypothetical protein
MERSDIMRARVIYLKGYDPRRLLQYLIRILNNLTGDENE